MYLLANLMQLGGFFIWSYSYQLIKQSSVRYKALAQAAEPEEVPKEVNKDFDANAQTQLLRGTTDDRSKRNVGCIRVELVSNARLITMYR